MVGQYLPKKSKFTFCYGAVKRQIFLTSKQALAGGGECIHQSGVCLTTFRC
jgi:hypothetical protein